MKRFVFAVLAVLFSLPAWSEEQAPQSFFLVSRPDLPDPNFEDTVVLMPRHPAGGPLGVIVNRPTPVPLSRFFPDIARLAKSDQKVFFGGPVGRERLSFVFRSDSAPEEDAIEVADGVYLSADTDLLRTLLRSDKTEGLRVFAGFAAWGPGQLENEIERGDWHLLPTDARVIFDRKPQGVWPELNRRASAVQVRAGARTVQPGPGRSPACFAAWCATANARCSSWWYCS